MEDLAPSTAPAMSGSVACALQLLKEGKFDEATLAAEAIALDDPLHFDTWRTVGNQLQLAGDHEGAVRVYRRLVELCPGNLLALHELATVLMEGEHLEEAIEAFERVCADGDHASKGYCNMGVAYRYAGDHAASRACFERAIALQPDFAFAKLNLAKSLLQDGHYEAFDLYEQRLVTAVQPEISRHLSVHIPFELHNSPRWDGGDLTGKHIVVWIEQGLGDSLMMMRYLPLLRQRGAARITALCSPTLVQTMRCVADAVMTHLDLLENYAFDCYSPSMSLPFHFATRLDSVPAQVPYLDIPPEFRSHWAGCLDRLTGLRVGVVWAGGPNFKRNAARSLELGQLAGLVAIEGVQWVSLQKGQVAEDLAEVDWPILDWAYHCNDLMDTAALIEQLDLVISVDTSVAHLAGALGKPVWMMSRFEGEWRWLNGRSDSPWYPTMRIFRQTRRGDWSGVLKDVGQALSALAQQHGPSAAMTPSQWALCVQDCVRGPQREAKKGFFSRWFGN